MNAFQITITVHADGNITIPPQPGLVPGDHHAVLLVEEQDPGGCAWPPSGLKPLDWSGWPTGSTYRREELYGEDGR
ncbi:MAG: hypothetical protein OHK0022_49460 [Roseiflexaceae bacterium]